MIDSKAETRWEKSNVSYQNYIRYIQKKANEFDLTIIDLFYVKNFKGGSATFNEPEEDINGKLTYYADILKKINSQFKQKNLHELNNDELTELTNITNQGFELVKVKSNTKIDGFSYSFLTTLFHFYFPNLLPILDRRVLNGLNLLKSSNLDSQWQVKNIQQFYPDLIRAFKQRTGKKSIRELDKEMFVIEFPKKN